MDARTEYTRLLAERRTAFEGFERSFDRISYARLALAAIAALMAWAAFRSGAFSPAWLLIPGALFLILMIVHEQVIQRRRRAERSITFFERGLARLNGTWHGSGQSGDEFRPAGHAYADDLDLFGQGSMFELLCAARTRTGEATLAQWLLHPSPHPDVSARQESVVELRERLDLREDLFLLGSSVRVEAHPDKLIEWGEGRAVPFGMWERWAAFVVAVIASAIGLGCLFGRISFRVFLMSVLAEIVIALWWRMRATQVIAAVKLPSNELPLISEVLERFEQEQFQSARLAALRSELDAHGGAPSKYITRLSRLVELLDSRLNQFFTPFASVMLWGTQFAMAIESWRNRNGSEIRRWLAAIGELEALSSLAGYAFERGEDIFPEFSADGPLLEADGLGHPLIPDERLVRNDLRLDSARQLLFVSGSNMSGKSTLLRSAGINVVMAWTGAPVCARRLRLSRLAVGASVRVQDSLQDNRSRFYSEIQRLRQIVDLADGKAPLLFLLDELLSGTNSHDRRIGAEAIVRGLVERGAIGLVTTHDLALTRIVDELAPRAVNVHFEDHLENGEIRFDFVMRAGVVERSNALELMRAVGLKV